jgi:hypothetical protein
VNFGRFFGLAALLLPTAASSVAVLTSLLTKFALAESLLKLFLSMLGCSLLQVRSGLLLLLRKYCCCYYPDLFVLVLILLLSLLIGDFSWCSSGRRACGSALNAD